MPFDNDSRSPGAILDELASHPHAPKLAELVHTLAVSAYDERRGALDAGLDEAVARIGVEESNAETSFGNVLRALKKRGAAAGTERTLLGALVARGVAQNPPADPQAQRRVGEALAWLAAHTVADPLTALEPALMAAGQAGALEGLFRAFAELVRAYDKAEEGAIDRSSAVLVALAIARASSEAVGRLRVELWANLGDPTLQLVLGAGQGTAGAQELVVSGEEAAAPRGSVTTFLLTITFLLPLVGLAKLFGRFALRLRRPAEMAFTKDGVTVRSRVEVLGKTVREKETFLATNNLVRAAREIRYPRLATYLGIASLLVGSYLGLRYVLDGFRSGSPEFLGLGLAILVVALAVDYGLSLLPARSPDRCRIVLEPRRGRVVTLARVDRTQAEAALLKLRP